MARPQRGPGKSSEDLTALSEKSARARLAEERKLYDADRARAEAGQVLTSDPPPTPKRRTVPLWVYVVSLVVVVAVGVLLIVRTPFRPVLVARGFTWGEAADGHRVEARGQVKNVAGKNLEDITAVVTFRDRRGAVIARAEAPIDRSPLPPGQTASFWVTENYQPSMQSAVVDFAFPSGRTLPTRHLK